MRTDTPTAKQAAGAVGCRVNQIAKSVIFRGETSGVAVLFVTPGGLRVNVEKASLLAREALGKADAALIRAQTGFAIGGVSPLGHLNPIRAFMDTELMAFDLIWVAAGTPHHMFQIDPSVLAIEIDAKVSAFSQ